MDRLFFQNKIIRNKKKTDIKTGIKPATGGIAKSLQWKYFPEQWIKEIHHTEYQATYIFMQLSHNVAAKVVLNWLLLRSEIVR